MVKLYRYLLNEIIPKLEMIDLKKLTNEEQEAIKNLENMQNIFNSPKSLSIVVFLAGARKYFI